MNESATDQPTDRLKWVLPIHTQTIRLYIVHSKRIIYIFIHINLYNCVINSSNACKRCLTYIFSKCNIIFFNANYLHTETYQSCSIYLQMIFNWHRTEITLLGNSMAQNIRHFFLKNTFLCINNTYNLYNNDK